MNDIITKILLGGDNKSNLKAMKDRLVKTFNETDNATVKMEAGFFYNLIVKYLKSNELNDYLKLIKQCFNYIER